MARQSDDVDKASHALLFLGKAHTRLRSPAAGVEALSAAIQVLPHTFSRLPGVSRPPMPHLQLLNVLRRDGGRGWHVHVARLVWVVGGAPLRSRSRVTTD